MKLKFIAQADFRFNEASQMAKLAKEPEVAQLKKGQCVLLISRTGKLLRFVFPQVEVEKRPGFFTTVLASHLYRVTGSGSWNPLMLVNYAAEVGLELEGLARFESYYRELSGKE